MKDSEVLELMRRAEFNQDAPPPVEQVVFRIQFQPIGSLGDFFIISGRPKSGKTKYVSGALSAAIYCKEIFQMNIRLPQEKNKVAHFDTEQSKYSHWKMMELIKTLSDATELPGHFKSYRCRSVAPSHMLAMAEMYLRLNPDTGLLFLDGLVDMVDSINDEKHCNFIKSWIKRITEQYNVMLGGVIHRGFSNDKSIGHLGSAMERTAQTVLVVESNRETKQFVLRTEYIRDGEHIAPVAIYYNKQMSIWEQTDFIDGEESDGKPQRLPKRKPGEWSIEEHRDIVRNIFARGAVQKYKFLCENIRECYGVGLDWAKQCVKHLTKEGLVYYSAADVAYTNVQQARLIPVSNLNR